MLLPVKISIVLEPRMVTFCDNKHLLVNASDQDLHLFQHSSRNTLIMLVLTSCGTIRGRKADGALLPSLLRALRNKCPVSQYMSIDVDVDNFDMDL